MAAGIWQGIEAVFVPTPVGPPDSDARRRARLAVVVSILVAAAGVAGAVVQIDFGTRVQAGMDLAMAVGALGVLAVLRRTGSLALAGNLLAASISAGFAPQIVLTAGQTTPPFLALIVLPMVAVMLAGRAAGIGWAIASCAHLALVGALLHAGLRPQIELPPQAVEATRLTSTAILIWAILAFTLIYESMNARALRDLGAARADADTANEAKGRFLANMSHEIRTPISGVIGTTELLLDTDLSGEQRELADAALRSAHALLDIVNDVLDLSKIEAGKLALETIDFALDPVLDLVRDVFSVRAGEAGIALRIHRDPAVAEWLRGDPVRLRHVLLNLVGNAVKFTPRGAVDVDVCSAVRADGSAEVSFAVRDTGIGIAEDRIASLFDEFTQADGSTTRRFGGTGLGLTIARHLVTLMGGSIEVTSRPGEGSTFSFRLPLEAGTPQTVQTDVRTGADAASGTLREAVAGRVLVVDDQPVNRTVVVRLLEKLGCTVDSAADGREALAAVTKHDYDLVLMDCQMPVMDGFEATAQIRGLDGAAQRVPIVALTANALAGDRQRCLAAGMDDYLTKPIRRAQLEALVRRILGA